MSHSCLIRNRKQICIACIAINPSAFTGVYSSRSSSRKSAPTAFLIVLTKQPSSCWEYFFFGRTTAVGESLSCLHALCTRNFSCPRFFWGMQHHYASLIWFAPWWFLMSTVGCTNASGKQGGSLPRSENSYIRFSVDPWGQPWSNAAGRVALTEREAPHGSHRGPARTCTSLWAFPWTAGFRQPSGSAFRSSLQAISPTAGLCSWWSPGCYTPFRTTSDSPWWNSCPFRWSKLGADQGQSSGPLG